MVWTLLLIALLILREYLLALHRGQWRPVLRTVNTMVLVMFGAAAVTAVIQLATVISPSAASAPVPSGEVRAGPTRSPARSAPATTIPTVAPTTTIPTVPPIPTPGTATPSPAQPTPGPTSGPTPTPQVTPMASLTTTPPASGGGTVTAGPTFRTYAVADGQVSGFRDAQADQRFSAGTGPPQKVAFPSLGDPEGSVRLVLIRTGPFTGFWVSPDDRGVEWVPAP